MSCHVIKGKEGKAIGFECNRGYDTPSCSSCGGKATKQCDFPLKGKKAGQSCDRPLCDRCATRYDEKEPGKDFCPVHARFMIKHWLKEKDSKRS